VTSTLLFFTFFYLYITFSVLPAFTAVKKAYYKLQIIRRNVIGLLACFSMLSIGNAAIVSKVHIAVNVNESVVIARQLTEAQQQVLVIAVEDVRPAIVDVILQTTLNSINI